MRTIVIGDIHGCSLALRSLLAKVNPHIMDTVIFLGDYVDRGPNTHDVIEQILALKKRSNVVCLRGNHEVMMEHALTNGMESSLHTLWMSAGGKKTLASYNGNLNNVPTDHVEFLQNLKRFHETDSAIFVHANYDPHLPMLDQSDHISYWKRLKKIPKPHQSGKRVFLGHTPQWSGLPLDRGHVVCLDTYCFGGRWLTAMDVDSGTLWQTDRKGNVRRKPRNEVQIAWQRVRDWIDQRLPMQKGI